MAVSYTHLEPVIGLAVEPKTQKDLDKLGIALGKLAEEDPTFTVHTDEAVSYTHLAAETQKSAVKEQALDANIRIREVQTEQDVIEAIRCIYHEYGYSYSYEKLYYVDNFMDLIRKGQLRSFLAVNDHGQIAGHFALAFSEEFPRMPEIATVVINRQFRGMKLFSTFIEHSLQVAAQMKMRAVMGQPTAFHPMSQRCV